MIILQIIAVLFCILIAIGFYRIEMMFHSVLQWIWHVNDKLTRIEYGQPAVNVDKDRAA